MPNLVHLPRKPEGSFLGDASLWRYNLCLAVFTFQPGDRKVIEVPIERQAELVTRVRTAAVLTRQQQPPDRYMEIRKSGSQLSGEG